MSAVGDNGLFYVAKKRVGSWPRMWMAVWSASLSRSWAMVRLIGPSWLNMSITSSIQSCFKTACPKTVTSSPSPSSLNLEIDVQPPRGRTKKSKSRVTYWHLWIRRRSYTIWQQKQLFCALWLLKHARRHMGLYISRIRPPSSRQGFVGKGRGKGTVKGKGKVRVIRYV